MDIDPIAIVKEFYPEDTPFRKRLLRHGAQVRDKAIAIVEAMGDGAPPVDMALVEDACFLHDIGCADCRASELLCEGLQPYIMHGQIGAKMLREYGKRKGIDMEPYARICERHISCGLTAAEIRHRTLLLYNRDYMPETVEEKLVCLANKFFSRSEEMREKSLIEVRRYLSHQGETAVQRFDELCRLFHVRDTETVSPLDFERHWAAFAAQYEEKVRYIAGIEGVMIKQERLNKLLDDARAAFWEDERGEAARWLRDFTVADKAHGVPLQEFLMHGMAMGDVPRRPEPQEILYVIVPFAVVYGVFILLAAVGVPVILCYALAFIAVERCYHLVRRHDLKKRAEHREEEFGDLRGHLDRARRRCEEILKAAGAPGPASPSP